MNQAQEEITYQIVEASLHNTKHLEYIKRLTKKHCNESFLYDLYQRFSEYKTIGNILLIEKEDQKQTEIIGCIRISNQQEGHMTFAYQLEKREKKEAPKVLKYIAEYLKKQCCCQEITLLLNEKDQEKKEAANKAGFVLQGTTANKHVLTFVKKRHV